MSSSAPSEGKRLWLQLLAVVPPFVTIALVWLGWLPLPIFPLSFVVAAALALYSLGSTGWAANQFGRARFQRGSDFSAFYWLYCAIYSGIGLVGLVAFLRMLTDAA